MKLIAVLVAFVMLIVAAVAAFAPAALLGTRLDAATQGQLRLANAEGSIWDGRGLVTNAQRTWSLPIAWKVAPLKIARGSFAIALPCTDPSLKRPPPLVPVFPLKTQRDKVRTL